MKKIVSILLVLVMVLGLFAGCTAKPVDTKPADTKPADTTPATTPSTNDKPLAGTYDIKVWVAEAITGLTKQQIDDFNANNDMGIVFNATVEAVGEGDSATSMTNDVANGADLFGFAQDQTARLIQAGALQALGNAASEMVKAEHDKASVAAVTSGDALYGYPMTSDNGYFMYYDKSVIPEEAVGSLEAIIAAAEAAGRNISFELENSWYIVSFFFATGCLSEWQTDTEGKFISVNDNFNSEAGLIAAKGLQKIVTSKSYVNSSATSDFEAAVPSAVVVSGTWNYENAKSILGDNLGIAELPSFEVDGNTYHLGSFNGCKLMGVKPQTDAVRAAAINQLAQYLTSEKCQTERFEANGWGPSNIAAQSSEAVKAAPHLTALMAQNNYSRPQGQIHGSWWDIAKVIATTIKEGGDLQTALDNYKASMEALFQMSDDVLNAWTVIGSIAGTNWDTDLAMTETDGIWKSNEAYEIAEGVEFKVRQGKSWDNNYGIDGVVGGGNVTLEWLGVEAGTYYIVFDSATGIISVEAA
jgi:arabinogalactan oligomer/maltooligosaccharide transport system substrate-binding protein